MAHNVCLEKHRYVWVQSDYVLRDPSTEFEPAIWWGVSSHPGRSLGCHVLLESGAVVLDLPLHALAHRDDALVTATARGSDADLVAQERCSWDNFGWEIEAIEVPLLASLEVEEMHTGQLGQVWFAVDWRNNGWSDYPEQHKWLWIVARNDGWLVARPQNNLLFVEKSFTNPETTERHIQERIQRQRRVWSCE
jgi:hypothetical protein